MIVIDKKYNCNDKVCRLNNIKVSENVSECAFGKYEKICSSENILHHMKRFLEKMGKSVNTDEEIINELKNETGCKSESCILSKKNKFSEKLDENVIQKELRKSFKPDGPAFTTELLSNFNIDDVLDQYVDAYTNENFLHIPFQMIDFQDYARSSDKDSNLASIDFSDKYNKGMRCFGVVLNTDYSSGGGKHWFAIFGDFRKHPFTLEYFNSSGNLPMIQIQKWMKNAKNDIENKLNKDVKCVITTRIQHQTDDHSCGPYSLYYITCRLENIPHEYFAKHVIKDSEMHLFRKHLFRHSDLK